jgi:small subunit ribosomal protein S6
MPDTTPVYELTLLLSTKAEEDTRARILADLEAAITRGGGSILRKSTWGNRGLAYRIEHEDDAEIHLFELTAPPNLLADLSHTLRITDGVLRFRVIKATSGGRRRPEPEPAAATTASAPDAEEAGAGES